MGELQLVGLRHISERKKERSNSKMLTKLSTFSMPFSGDPIFRLFRQGSSIRRLAGDYVPEVRDWLRTYKSDQEHLAVLVNALGGSEYWGQNRNGDNYYWPALSHHCDVERALCGAQTLGPPNHPIDTFTQRKIPPYGYSTFLKAHPFVHHKNKDPNRAFGKVVLSCLNPRMKRVELVVLINRASALLHGAETFLARLDRGELPDVSMGCRTPYDICTICGHKSRTPQDYCVHVTELGMNRILSDGRQVGVINPYPNFFDISFVFVGADRTAKTMAKLASGTPQSIIDAEELYGNLVAPPHREQKPYAGTILWQGLKLNIEVPRGTWRTGKTWSRRMKVHYGEIEGTKGVDGDAVDVYVGENLDSSKVFVAHQNFVRGQNKGAYDEDKVMIGFNTIDEAKQAYLEHYDKPEFLRSMTEMSVEAFKKMLRSTPAQKLAADSPMSEICGSPLRSAPSKNSKLHKKRHVSKLAGMKDIPRSERHKELKRALEDAVDIRNYKDKGVADISIRSKGPALWGLWNMGSASVEMTDQEGRPIFMEEGEHPFSYGTADLSLHKNWLNPKHRVEYDSLYLKPAYRRRGIGSQILRDAIKATKTLDVEKATMSADEDGRLVWPSMDIGAKFVHADKVHELYQSWRKKHGGPDVPKGSASNRYPKPFLNSSLQDGGMFLKLEVPIQEKTASTDLQDLFSNFDKARKRQRVWASEGKKTHATGSGITKEASVKVADLEKVISPSGVTGLVSKVLDLSEPSLQSVIQDSLSREDFSKVLSTALGLGINLKPDEFQSCFLRSNGYPQLAESLERSGLIFSPGTSPLRCGQISSSLFDTNIAEVLRPWIESRSYLRPVLCRRILKLKISPIRDQKSLKIEDSPLLAKVACAYAWYQEQMAKQSMDIASEVVADHPWVKQAVFNLTDSDIFHKVASASELASLGTAAATVPVVLLLSSSARRDMEEGKDVGFLRRLLAKNPFLASLGSATLAKAIMQDKLINQAVRDLASAIVLGPTKGSPLA